MSDSPLKAEGEPFPVGKDENAQRRNAVLLSEYEYDKYNTAITGYTGQDLQRIAIVRHEDAVRTRIGPRGNYKAGFTRLADGRLLIAVCRQDIDPNDPTAQLPFQIYVYRSDDGGLTWKQIAKPGICGKEPTLTVLPDGAVFMTAQNADFTIAKRGTYCARSQDDGHTWQIEEAFNIKYPRNVIVEADGSLLLFGTAGKPEWNLNACRSDDSGRTWRVEEGKIAWRHEDRSQFDEVSAVRLDNGTLLASLRREIPGASGEGFEDTFITRSQDEGKTWSTPTRMSDNAEVHCYLTKLSDKRILATYSNYHLPYSSCVVASHDNGLTWDRRQIVRVSLSADIWVGWAVTLELPDGDLITSYAVTSYQKQPPNMLTCEVVRWRWPD